MAEFTRAVSEPAELERATKGKMTKICRGAVRWLLGQNVQASDAELHLMCRLTQSILSSELLKRLRALEVLVSMGGNHLAMQAIKRLATCAPFADVCAQCGAASAVAEPPLHDKTHIYEEAVSVFMANFRSKAARLRFCEALAGTEKGMSLLIGMACKNQLIAYKVMRVAGTQALATWGADQLLRSKAGLAAAAKAGVGECQDFFRFTRHASDALRVRLYVKLSESDWSHGGSASTPLDWLAMAGCVVWKADQLAAIVEMFDLYKKNVMKPLFDTFERTHPKALVLCQVAEAVGLDGSSESVLKELAKHATRGRRIMEREADQQRDKSVAMERSNAKNIRRMKKAFEMLNNPSVWLQRKVERQTASTKPVSTKRPPSSDPAPPLHEYLKRHVRPRNGCARCEVARGADPGPRIGYPRDGTGTRDNVSNKRACPFAEHAVFVETDLLPLIAEYDRMYRVKRSNKRVAASDFMKDTYGVEPLGGHQGRVTIYEMTRVKAALENNDGRVSLKLSASRPVQRCHGVYAGFEVV